MVNTRSGAHASAIILCNTHKGVREGFGRYPHTRIDDIEGAMGTHTSR
jgi:hypothetical protein